MKSRTLTGPYGQAWTFDLDVLNKGMPANPMLDVWAIKVPWANPSWDTYVLHLIHLRPVPGMPEVRFYLPGATHEISLYAMQPGYRFQAHVNPGGKNLTSVNFVGQFITHDLTAIAKVEACVMEILNGDLSPDTDYGQHWIARFGAHCIQLADPTRLGETIIQLGGKRNIVIDPAPLSRKPKDILCKFCKMPAVATQVTGDDICLRCCKDRRITPKGAIFSMFFGQ